MNYKQDIYNTLVDSGEYDEFTAALIADNSVKVGDNYELKVTDPAVLDYLLTYNSEDDEVVEMSKIEKLRSEINTATSKLDVVSGESPISKRC